MNDSNKIRIQRIETIKNSISATEKIGKEVDYDKLEVMCCSTWGVPLRMAKELIRIAKSNLVFKE